ncbi:pyrroline-5-carboxylate reductase 3-like [Lytechinus pictus]|uniref:pyrroline-5-carboxylate reductase 3-like n=1 Tax=Lytechinus pictus TaxID=7653 RepID=UPI0030B9D7F5
MALANLKIGFIGAGSMAQGMIEGWIRANVVKPSQLMASAPSDRNLSKLRERGLSTTHDNAELVRSCTVVVIACKPYQCKDVLPPLPFGPHHLVLSVVAALSCPAHEALLRPGTRLVRTMPNVAIAVCEGIIGVVRGSHATDEDMAIVDKLVQPIAFYEVMSDPQLDLMSSAVCTGVAWAAMVMEGLADGAVMVGLPRSLALKTAAITLMGTGKLHMETGKHPGEIKDSVCSPGGSTIRGVHALEKSGVRAAMMNAVEAATEQIKNMSKK